MTAYRTPARRRASRDFHVDMKNAADPSRDCYAGVTNAADPSRDFHAGVKNAAYRTPARRRASRRACYWRRKEGRLLLDGVEVPLYALADKLVEDGFLEEWDADDPEKVCEAVAQFLRAYSS